MGRTLIRYHNISPEAIAALLCGGVAIDPTNFRRDVAQTALTVANICRAGKQNMISLVVDSHDTRIVNDNFSTFNSNTWGLCGTAAYQSDGYIRLTPAQNNCEGGIYLKGGLPNSDNFRTSFSIWAGLTTNGGADEITCVFAADNFLPSTMKNGYVICFDEYGYGDTYKPNNVSLEKSTNGTRTKLVEVPVPFDLDDQTWRNAEIALQDKRLTVRLAGQTFIDYSPIEPTGYNGLGFWGRTGGYNNEHRIDNIFFISTSLLISDPVITDIIPTMATLFVQANLASGTVTYYLSRDDGTTWTQVQPGIEADLSSQPPGNALRIKAELTGDAYIDGWALMWR